jgi:4-carboxymuconolactone decarboxylase
MESERFERGHERLTELRGEAALESLSGVPDGAADLGRYVVEFAYGEVYSRPGLTLRERQIATVAALTALGTAQTQLRIHIEGALRAGLTEEEIFEVIIQMALYGGFPAALNAVAVAREVFAERGTDDAGP